MRFGVLRFPGSCDEVDALLACRRYAEAELIWHGDRDLDGVSDVRVGRLVELEVVDASEVSAMCEKLLANPLIEDYEVIPAP